MNYWNIVAACWVVFWLYWTANGWRAPTPKRSVSWSFTVPNTLLLYAGFVLMLHRGIDIAPLSIRFAPTAEWFAAVATALVASGIAFATWSRVVLGASWSATVRIHADQRVVRSGPYAFVAHPIYTGISLAALGTALVSGTLASGLGFALILVSFCSKGRMEERLMNVEFGSAYADYRRGVKFIIPFVW
jgi:protein-S-isoprenylcysteine O-methyltransferase Ste14